MELDIHFAFHDFIGMFTSWAINCPTVLTFGVNSTSSNHLLILVKILFNELSFLGTWERFELLDTGTPTPPPLVLLLSLKGILAIAVIYVR